MWADVIMHRDTLRVYNNHMQSTQVNESDREYLSGTACPRTRSETSG